MVQAGQKIIGLNEEAYIKLSQYKSATQTLAGKKLSYSAIVIKLLDLNPELAIIKMNCGNG